MNIPVNPRGAFWILSCQERNIKPWSGTFMEYIAELDKIPQNTCSEYGAAANNPELALILYDRQRRADDLRASWILKS